MQRIQNLSSQLKSSSSLEANKTFFYGRKVWVMKAVDAFEFEQVGNLKGKIVVITGASRGIGLAIGKRLAQDGASVAILAKTAEAHPKLPGTIYTAAKEIEQVGGKALPILCDIRFEDQVKAAIDKVVQTFGGIDILINNASAISLTKTTETDMKRYDLMHSINTRGTYMVSKYCIPHLKNSKNGHILNISPPLNMETQWFAPHVGYTMAKYGMSMCVLGMSGELKEDGIAVNALWPRTAISTAAVQNLLGGDESIKLSRNELIMADAAHIILTSNSKKTTGQFFMDDEVLASVGQTNLDKYKVSKDIDEKSLIADYFC